MSGLQPFHARVISERDELSDRLDKLRAFYSTTTYKNLPIEERSRLVRQELHMGQYLSVLNERIAAFPTA